MIQRRWFFACCIFFVAGHSLHAGDPADATVRVFATVRDPDWLQPWNKQKPFQVVGSGTIIEDKRILTNSHIVLYATEVYVQGSGRKKVPARVKVVAPGIDLALLTVENADVLPAGVSLPRRNKLPAEKSLVEIHGYRSGADKVSLTKSRVFRIDYVPYSPQSSGLQVQIDDVVEPGMSGGPVMAGKQMIGLALNLGKGDKFGHIIPNEEITGFLEDAADGRYHGKPWLSGYFQNCQNEALRAKLGLAAGRHGLMVTRASEPLQPFDVLTHVGKHPINDEGQVQLEGELRVSFQYWVARLARNGKVTAGVLRKSALLQLDLPVVRPSDFLLRETNGEYPPYFLYGPLVFSPVSLESAGQIFQLNPDPLSPLVQRRDDQVRFTGEELVAVTSIFPHACLAGYPDPRGRIVREVDGIAVKNLPHLMNLLKDGKNEFVTLGFGGDPPALLVLTRKDMARVTKELMGKHRIPR